MEANLSFPKRDIQEEKFSRTSQKGWLGISDKFWITSLIPPSGKEFKTTFDYKNKFRANFVTTEPHELKKNSSIEEKINLLLLLEEFFFHLKYLKI